MTYAVYNLTDYVQLSIRGTTGSQPNSKFVFGIYMGGEDIDNPRTPDFHAYDDMDWSEAVKMAHWILEQDEWIRKVKE